MAAQLNFLEHGENDGNPSRGHALSSTPDGRQVARGASTGSDRLNLIHPSPSGVTFYEFDAAHPDVWQLFERFTLDLIRRGFGHYSSDAVLHRVRWETSAGAGSDEDAFKINNNWTAYYARKFDEQHPEYAGFFRMRRSKADEAQ